MSPSSVAVRQRNDKTTLEKSLVVSYKIRGTLSPRSSNSAAGYSLNKNENKCPHQPVPECSRQLYLESPRFIKHHDTLQKRPDRPTVRCPCHGTLLGTQTAELPRRDAPRWLSGTLARQEGHTQRGRVA